MSQQSYRHSHQAADKGKAYRRTYERGYYAAQWRELEEPLLRKLLIPYSGPDKACLDFACGTARLSRFASPFFGHITGVDVSESMLMEAVAPANVELILRDLTREPIAQRFDVALAFRFFLNADEQLRVEALQAIRNHLKENGHLICNVHMTKTSVMGHVYDLLAVILGRTIHNTMASDTFIEFLESQGFAIESVTWYSFLPRPGHFFPRTCELILKPFERMFQALRLPARWAQAFVVVARKV